MRLIAWILILIGFGYAQTLDELLGLIESENNRLKAFTAEKKALAFEGDASSYLANPKLGFSYYPNAVMTANGAQRSILTASQCFPWFGTLNAREEIYHKREGIALGQHSIARDQLRYQVKSAYYMLAGFQKKQVIYERYKSQLATYLNSSLSKYQAGKGSQLDIITIQTELSFIDQTLMALDDEIEMQLHQINHIVNRVFKQIPAMFPSQSSDIIVNTVISQNNDIQMLELQKSELDAKINLEDKKAMPSFSLGLIMHSIEKENAYGVQLSVEIPLFSGTNSDQIEALEQRKQVLDFIKMDKKIKLNHDLERYASRKQILVKRKNHILNTLKPQANLAYTTGLIAYENGKLDLTSVLNSKRLLNELEINLTQLESSFWINESQIDLLLSGSEKQ